jgi:isoamylase
MEDFTRRLIALRRAHPVFRRQEFLHGREDEGSGLPDVYWFRSDGHRMTQRDWHHGPPVLGMFLNGEEISTRGPRGERIIDDSFLLLFNAHHETLTFTLPSRRFGRRWTLELSTADPEAEAGSLTASAQDPFELMARSTVILRRVTS